MKVTVAEKCGFCHGVRNAISIAEKILECEKEVYSLGPVIHNKDVVDRLARKGLKTVGSIDEITSGTVLIRSHGAAPDEIDRIKQKGLKIVDATCVMPPVYWSKECRKLLDSYKMMIIRSSL